MVDKHTLDVVLDGRDRLAASVGDVENLDQSQVKIPGGMGEAFDLSVEANHVPYLNALLLSRIFPSLDDETARLEAALRHQPKGTMNKLMAAGRQLYEAFDERCSILLDDFERRYITENDPHV